MTTYAVADKFWLVLAAINQGNHTEADRLVREMSSLDVKEFYRAVQAVKAAIETAEGIMS